jgi:glutaredoxin
MMRAAIFALLLGVSLAASAQLYRWTDERGRVHVTDTPPPPSARKAERKEYEAASGGASAGGEVPYALRAAMQSNPITLYTAPNCRPCADARRLLNARGAPFREVSVVGQPHTEELRQLVGSLSVPALKVGASVQRGFEEAAYHTLLDAAGYPRTGILPARNQAEPSPQSAAAPAAAPAEPEAPKGPYAPR